MLWSSGYYSPTHICTLFEAQWILSNFLQQDACCWLWHSEGSFVVLNLSLAESIKTLTPMWWVEVIQIRRLLHEKLRVTATSSSTANYLVKNLFLKNVDLCENNVILGITVLWNPCWGLLHRYTSLTFNECKYWQKNYQWKLNSDLTFYIL